MAFMKISLRSAFFTVLYLITIQTYAADYFVAKNGNDANDGSSANPWLTIQRAANVATAGDTVTVRAGIYYEPSEFASPASEVRGLRPLNNGTAGNPIVFQGEPGAVIDQNYEAQGFYLFDREYITIRGFEIRRTLDGIWTHSSSGASALSRAIIIENNHIHHAADAAGRNVGLIELDSCRDCIVRNNLLHHAFVDGTTNNQNATGVISFGMQNALIENNEIHSVHTGIFHKRFKTDTIITSQGSVFRRNKIHNAVWGIQYSVAGTGNRGHNDQVASYNLMYNLSSHCIIATLRDTGAPDSVGLDIFNNTFDGCGVQIGGYSEVEIYNNIFANATRAIGIEASRDSDDAIATLSYSNYNVYFPDTTFTQNLFATNGSREEYSSFSEWNAETTAANGGFIVADNGGFTTTALVTNISDHANNSSVTDPQFRSTAARDYRATASLGNGSPDNLGFGTNLGVGAYAASNTDGVGLSATLDPNLADKPRAIEDLVQP